MGVVVGGGVFVAVGVGVAVFVGVGVGVAVGGAGVIVAVGVGVGVAVGAGVTVGVGVFVAVGEGAAVGVFVGDGATVGVGVFAAAGEGVAVGVFVGDRDGAAVGGTGVGVFVAVCEGAAVEVCGGAAATGADADSSAISAQPDKIAQTAKMTATAKRGAFKIRSLPFWHPMIRGNETRAPATSRLHFPKAIRKPAAYGLMSKSIEFRTRSGYSIPSLSVRFLTTPAKKLRTSERGALVDMDSMYGSISDGVRLTNL